MLGSWEIAYIDSTHRKLSKTGLRCSGTILEGGVLFIDQEAAIGSCSCSGVKEADLTRHVLAIRMGKETRLFQRS